MSNTLTSQRLPPPPPIPDAFRVRPMQARDVPRTVEVHCSAFPGFFLTFLGSRFLEQFYLESVELGEIALVGELDKSVVGFVVGSAKPGGFFRSLLRRRMLGFALAALPAVLRRPGSSLRLLRALWKPREATKAPGTATLMSLGVDSGAQGLGAGKALVQAFLKEAANRGATKVDLTTDKVGNDRTNAFYQRLGMRVAREIFTPEGRILYEYEIDVPGDFLRSA